MSPDPLDPEQKEKNIAQNQADALFNSTGKPTHPDLKEPDDSVGSGFYRPDQTGEGLAEQEAAGGSAPLASGGDESRFYRPESQAPAGRFQNGLQSLKNSFSKGSAKKKALYAAGGAGGAGLIIAALILLFMIISGFGVGQVAEVAQIANYSRLHLASGRRTSQYITEKALNPNPEAFRVQTQKRTLLDRFIRFDPNKGMGNLRTTGELEFVRPDGTKRRFGIIGREVPLNEVKSLEFGNRVTIDLPDDGISNFRARGDFIRSIDAAVNDMDSLAGKSRIHRTKMANSIIKASGIKLYRWEKAGRTIKTFKDSLLSGYDRLKGGSTQTSSMPEVRESADEYDKTLEEMADNPPSAAAAGDQALEAATRRSNAFNAFVRTSSISSLTATLYCSGRDYIGATEENSKERVKQYKQSGYLTLSAYDQIKSGDTTAKAVMMEAKSLEGFSDSRRYQEATGNPNASTMKNDLDRSESPVVDRTSGLYRFYAALVSGVEGQVGLNVVPDSLKDRACNGIVSIPGQIFLSVSENILSAISGVFSGGATTAGQQTARVALQQGFREAAESILTREVGQEIAKRAATGVAKDAFMYLLVDMAIKTIHNTTGNSTLDDGYKQYAKKDIGLKLDANEKMLAIGARKLSEPERAELDNMINERRYAQLHKQPLTSRLFGLSDPMSPSSLAVATLPTSPNSLKNKGAAFAQKSINPLQTISQTSVRLSSTILGSDRVMAAQVTGDEEELDIPTIGFSKSELDKMLEESYWPLQNAQIVESNPAEYEEFIECFQLMTETVEPPCADKDMTTDKAFRARLYQMDGGNASETETDSDFNDGVLGGLLDLQEVTEPSSSGGDSTLPSGSAQELAKQILANSRITYTTDFAKQAIEATAAGQPAAIEARCGAGTSAPLSPTLLAVMLKVAEQYSVGYGYFTNGCHSANSLHYSGKAADINQVNGNRATGGKPDEAFMQYLTTILPNGSSMGLPSSCPVNASINPVNQVRLHDDSCNHIHIGVP